MNDQRFNKVFRVRPANETAARFLPFFFFYYPIVTTFFFFQIRLCGSRLLTQVVVIGKGYGPCRVGGVVNSKKTRRFHPPSRFHAYRLDAVAE